MGTDTELVLPVSSRGSTRPRRAAVRLLSAGALFLLLAYLLTPRAPSVPEDAHVSAYWDAVSSRNFERVLADKYDARITALPHCKHDNKITPARAEQIYLSVPSNDSAAAASLRYTSHAHSAGTGWDFVTALQVKNDWERALGVPVTAYDEAVYDAGEARAQARIKHGMGRLSVWVDTYYPVMNSPVYGAVTLLSDPPVKAKLREAHLKGDPDSELADEVRAFHGFSVSGDVTAKYVYVGYGRKADFDCWRGTAWTSMALSPSSSMAACSAGLKSRRLRRPALSAASSTPTPEMTVTLPRPTGTSSTPTARHVW
jgi:hypothetical protein